MRLNMLRTLAGLAIALNLGTGHAAGVPLSELPELNIDIEETTVSGISSGAFMAVQMGVAKSASIRGVAATAGGPYFCALDASFAGAGSTTAIARCMQGDPALGVRPISSDDLEQMAQAAKNWAAAGKIDPVSNLARQAVWVFHGYNDGIVKRPVSNALVDWYSRFTPTTQIFHKDNLNAAHAQISAACGAAGAAASCNTCPTTGGKFINGCTDQPAPDNPLYDAAGAALQWFYGPLSRTDTEQLSTLPQPFSQLPYLKKRNGQEVDQPEEIAMGSTGYVYIPQSCRQGEACRLHIAFHGCMQSATSLDTDFATGAGVNEWADASRIVVLYPQALPTPATAVPANPMGCWDWWGYNDRQDLTALGAKAGYFATRDGVQIAAVWRMVEKLAAKGTPSAPARSAGPAPTLQALDRSASQAVLRWQEVENATAYQVYRAPAGQEAVPVGKATSQPFLVDSGLAPTTRYTYTVRAIIGGEEAADSNAASITTARQPPADCDPYFSLTLNTPVKKVLAVPLGVPTTEVCP